MQFMYQDTPDIVFGSITKLFLTLNIVRFYIVTFPMYSVSAVIGIESKTLKYQKTFLFSST